MSAGGAVCLSVCPFLPLPLSPVCICVCRCMRALWVSLSLPLSLALSFSCPALCLSVSQSLSPSFLEICSCCAVGSLSSPGCSFYLPGSTSRNDPVTADKLEVVYIPVTADSKLPAPLGLTQSEGTYGVVREARHRNAFIVSHYTMSQYKTGINVVSPIHPLCQPFQVFSK